jgi:hypothetical protein
MVRVGCHVQDAGQADEIAGQEGLVGGVVGDRDAEEVVRVAEYPAQLDDLLVAGRGGLELLHGLQVIGVDAHVDEDFQAAADGGRVDDGA